MSQDQIGFKRIPSIGIVAAFGLITMSSSIVSQSLTTIDMQSNCYCEIHNYSLEDNNICNSSLLFKQAVGDIISTDRKSDFVQKHERINVSLKITKIFKHISNFDFEEEFEEI